MSSTFPLLKLPYLCIQSVLCSARIREIIIFSTLSKASYRLVNFLESSLETVNILMKAKSMTVMFEKNQVTEGFWFLHHSCEKTFAKVTCPSTREKIDFPQLINEQDPLLLLESVIKYLANLFKVRVRLLLTFSDDLPDTLLLFKYMASKKVRIEGKQTISNDRLSMLLDTVTTKEVLICVPLQNDFVLHTTHLKFDILSITTEISRETSLSILSMNLARIQISESRITYNDCCTFVRQWLASDTTKFECMIFFWKDLDVVINNDLEQLQPVQRCEKRRGRYYRFLENLAIDCEEAVDLQRHDGLWASIRVFEKRFFFGVWHTLFHDVDGLKVL